MTDARFEDAEEKPIRLRAESAEDLEVISALLQDAAGKASDVAWLRGRRRLAMVINRFRWEDKARAEAAGRPVERVRAGLHLDNVLAVRAKGIHPRDKDSVFALLGVVFEPGEAPAGVVRFVMAGEVEIEAEVEALDLTVADISRPWEAKAGRAPRHPED